MTDDIRSLVADLRGLLEKATPWRAEECGNRGAWIKGAMEACGDSDASADANAALIVALHNHAGTLLDALDRAQQLADERVAAEREAIRETFLNMIADADRWDEDVVGDADDYGRPVITVNYDLRVGHSQLQELCDALGVEAKRYDETLKDAIDNAIAEPPAIRGDAK